MSSRRLAVRVAKSIQSQEAIEVNDGGLHLLTPEWLKIEHLHQKFLRFFFLSGSFIYYLEAFWSFVFFRD